ncbi:hypothetical protein IAU60_006573 [Kwoniella sp. DSM 27419]
MQYSSILAALLPLLAGLGARASPLSERFDVKKVYLEIPDGPSVTNSTDPKTFQPTAAFGGETTDTGSTRSSFNFWFDQGDTVAWETMWWKREDVGRHEPAVGHVRCTITKTKDLVGVEQYILKPEVGRDVDIHPVVDDPNDGDLSNPVLREDSGSVMRCHNI